MAQSSTVRRDDAEGQGWGKAAAMRVIGLGLLLAWFDLAFFSKLIHYSTRNSITHLNSVYMLACAGTAVVLVAIWAVWHFFGSRQVQAAGEEKAPGGVQPTAGRPFSVAWMRSHTVVAARAATGLLMVSTVALSMVEHRLFTQPWCSIFSVAAGVALGVLYLVWAYLYVPSRRNELAIQLGLAFLVGALVYVATLYLPELVGIAVCVLLPGASLFVAEREIDATSERVATGDREASLDLDEARAIGAYRPKRGYLARTFSALLLVGLAESFERALFMSLNPSTERMANHWILLAATVAAVVVIVVATIVVEGRAQAVFVNRVIMFVMAVLFLLAPIVEGIGLLSDLAALTCHFLLYLLLWTMLVRMSGEYRISVVATFAPGMGVASLGCWAGTLVGSIVMSFVEPGYRTLSLFALICAVLAIVAFAFLLTEDVVVDITNSDPERPTGPRRFELRCREVAKAYGLSARETEVMILAAKGRTNQRIQEELGISTGTVNTHFAHIYKKLDVHDRQQMLDMIDANG